MSSAAQRSELQSQIWKIANEVRGSVDGWDFKQYVLGTLFYRFISENFSNHMKTKKESWSVHFFAIHYYMMISSHLKGNPEWRSCLDRIISNTNFKDVAIRECCVKNNRRGFHMFCKEREEAICTMLK